MLTRLKDKRYENLSYFDNTNMKADLRGFEGLPLITIILYQEPVEDCLYDCPEYFKKTPIMHSSEIRQEVNRRMVSIGFDDIKNKLAEHFQCEPTGHDFWKNFDNYIEQLADSHVLDAQKKLTDDWAYFKWLDEGYDETETEYDKVWETGIKHKYAEEFAEYARSIYLPKLTFEYHRRYDRYPFPINKSTTPLSQQFFLIEDKGVVYYGSGSSSGSLSRYHKGYFAHLFAKLVSKGSPIETHIMRITSMGKLEPIEGESALVLDRYDLTGNYDISAEDSKKILGDTRLVSREDFI